MYQQLIDHLKNKRIVLLGMGREGHSTYNFIRRYLPEQKLIIADAKQVELDNDPNVEFVCGDGYLGAIDRADIVIKTPGIPLLHFKRPQGVEVTCQTDLFLRFSGFTCVGVTGTKGKTTTSTLIYSMLRAAGKEACLIGNMGYPVFDNIEDCAGEIAVIEMSSHQLEFTTCSPHIAVLTNIYPEHLDHYDSFECYVGAKLNIVRNQSKGDTFIYNSDQGLDGFFDMSKYPGEAVGVSVHTPDAEKYRDINSHLLGEHNIQNCMFAAEAARRLGVSDEDIMKALKNYEGIEHRMEYFATVKGIKFVNDCIATIPHSVMCAVEALGDVDTLIFGGMDRGLDYSAFEKALEMSSIRNLVCLPDTGHKIGMHMAQNGSEKKIIISEDMEGAVRAAMSVTRPGYTCLLSPAASSYNKYKNFEEKGRHFKNIVRRYAEMGGEKA